MRKKRHSAEEIVNKLREVDLELSRGQTVPQACRKIGVTESARACIEIGLGISAHTRLSRHEP